MCCDWTAVETQSKLGLSSWILFILIYHLPSFLGVPFSFHRVQPTFFFFAIWAMLFVLSLSLPRFAFPLLSLPSATISLHPSNLFHSSILPLSSFSSCFLSGRPPTRPPICKRVRERERETEGRARSINTKRPSRVATLGELDTAFI